ncbi:MAG: non-ribosomal peptide synthetase, partial [bacterium]
VFTSGSTGSPKGVDLSHRGLASLVDWHCRRHAVVPGDRATLVAGLGFDASVWEVWPYLAAGASLHQVPEEVISDPRALGRWLVRERITLSFLPTPLAEALVGEPPPELTLRALLTGGDRLRRRPRRDLGFAVINNYGPSEATVVSTNAPVGAEGDEAGPPSIGRPVDGTVVHVLDRNLQAVPPGVPGEIQVAGTALARGYCGAPGQTARRFVPHPFGAPGARLYRTGDRARHLADGRLDFLGRLDDQVKVRGFRIEPGEIEVLLARHETVREAAVIAHEDGDEAQRLVAFVVPVKGAAPETPELRSFLSRWLPPYMVPSAVVVLELLPLTPNGKVDRRALAAAAGGRSGVSSEYVAPRSSLEAALANIWVETLGVERVGIHDDFFELGGHSLQVTQILARVRQELGVEVEPRRLFEEPTVAALSRVVAETLLAGVAKDEAEALLGEALADGPAEDVSGRAAS